MNHRVSALALSVAAFGAVTVFSSSAVRAESDYLFPKDPSVEKQKKTESSVDKKLNSDEHKSSKNTSLETDKKSNQTKIGATVATQDKNSKTRNGGFRPDFDGAGGRGPAVNAANDRKDDSEGFYIKTRGYRLEPEPDIPPYVRNLAKTYGEFKDIDWLNVGLDSRTRYEYRENSLVPRPNTSGIGPSNLSLRQVLPYTPWLVRTRGYVGIKDIFDPLRFVVEFQDSRAFNSIYPLAGQDINETELIQGFGELYLKDALGKDSKGQGRAISIRAGRMAFEIGSRRLIARNEFRNTTNNFEGFRLRLGERHNDVDLDSFLMRPVIRYPYAWDQPEWNNWIYGSFMSIRNISPYLTVQPYFIGRHQYGDPLNTSSALKVKRDTQAPGLRVYGNYNNFDWDIDVMKQFGTVGAISQTYPYIWGANNISSPFGGYAQTKQHDALAYGIDVGYTFAEHPWKPRISAVYIYGSGNSSPWSSTNSNVDTFYGFNQPFSRNDYIGWNNVKDPKVRIEFEPVKDTRIDTAFSSYWLASASSAWDRANLWAPLGNRGTFMGTELDFRVRQKLNEFVNVSASYARFWPGSFTSSFAPPTGQQIPPVNLPGGTIAGQTGTTDGLSAKPSNFFYMEATVNAFGDGKPIAKIPGSDFVASWDKDAKEQKKPTWNDVYVGLNGGGAWSSPVMTVQDVPQAFQQSGNPILRSTSVANATGNTLPSKYVNSLSGFIGGVQLGANWNIYGNILAGFEADLDGTAGNTNSQKNLGQAVNSAPTSGVYTGYTTYNQHSTTLNYLGTARGRLGYLITPTVLIYGTGGLAYGGVTAINSYTWVANTSSATSYAPRSFGATYAGTLTGWSAGGGLEWMFTPEWSVKGDYLYYDLGSVSFKDNYSSTPWVYAPNNSTNYGGAVYNSSWSTASFSGNVIHAGINRHFDVKGIVTLTEKDFDEK